MGPEDLTRIRALYEARLAELGEDVRTLGWRSTAQQHARFRALDAFGPLRGRSVLDIGCGFGGFLDYLDGIGETPVRYTGVEISSGLLTVAERLHGHRPGVRFVLGEAPSCMRQLEAHDVVVASGVVNAPMNDNYAFTRSLLEGMFGLSRLGAAINMLSDNVDYVEDRLFYYSSTRMLDMALGLTGRVLVRHDYMPFEFTVCLYRESTMDADHVFVPVQGC
jgi:SAM-dependent methyltransferase